MFGALLTDLSKAFYCFLRNRKQRTRANNAHSSWQNILYGVPQGLILGSLSFNIYLCGLLFMRFISHMKHEDVANYADDNTPYVSGKDIDEVVRFLETSSCAIFKWFGDNLLQANTSKCHMLLYAIVLTNMCK